MATIRKKGDYQWHVQIRRKHVTATKTFVVKSDAEAWAREIESEIDRGVYVSRAEAEATKMADVCDRYERECLPKLKGKNADKSRLKTIKEKLGKLPVGAVSSTALAKFRDERLEILSSQSVIHELGLITRILKACVLDWGIALPGGVPQVRKPSAPPGRSRRVSQEEIDAIAQASKSQQLESIVKFAVETALRRGEIASLTWDAVDLKKPTLMLDETKNGDSREVPLSKAAIQVLKLLPRRIDGSVYGMQPDSITQAFERAVIRARSVYESECKKQGIQPSKSFLLDLNFHDLRHEATSRIALKVSNLVELASITGHKDLQMLKRYYHPRAEDLAKKLG